MKLVLALVAILLALDASGQIPRRERGGSPREAPSRDRARDAVPNFPADPFAALERELPSLEVDLALKPGQLDAWRVFTRDVRDVAEMGRSRRKHLMALRESGERPATAGTLFAYFAEDDRAKADGSADAKRHFDQLFDQLDDVQKRTLNKRVIQSQVEPLGR